MEPRVGDLSLFPSLRARAYLAHCAISPVSAPVAAAVTDYLQSFAELGSGAFGRWFEQRAALRSTLAGLVGARAEDVALVASTTIGVVDVAFALDWRPGDRVVVFDGEFPANVTPWQQAATTFGLELVPLPLTGFGVGDEPVGEGMWRLENALRRGGVRLVAVSAVQFQTGLAMPLAEIATLCRRYGAELFVDAIQAVGVVPIDVSVGIDYLTCGSHKWLMGTEGGGFLYVAPDRVRGLVPRLAGWLSHEDPVGFLFGSPLRYDRPIRARADAFEIGAVPGASLAALGASAGLVARVGVPAIAAHVQAWHELAEPPLLARGFRSLRSVRPEARSGTLALRAPEDVDVQALVRALHARGVVTSAPEGCLRLAPTWPNPLDQAALTVDAIDDALAELRRT